MISRHAEEVIDLRGIIVPVISYGRHYVTFIRDVEVKTYRNDPMVTDGVIWEGVLNIQAGESIPVRHTERGYRQRPCRLNTLSIPTSSHALKLIDVPEDSYEESPADSEA